MRESVSYTGAQSCLNSTRIITTENECQCPSEQNDEYA